MTFDRFLTLCREIKDLPRIPDQELLEEKVIALRSGTATEDDMNWIVLQHVRLVLSKLKNWVRHHNAPDLTSDTLLLLVELVKVRAAESLTDNNITPWISDTVTHRLADLFLIHRSGHFVSPRTLRRLEAAGVGFSPRLLLAEEHLDETIAIGSDTDTIDLVDYIYSIPKTSAERMTVRLMIDGYTQEEIGRQVNLAQSTVNGMVRKIRDRFLCSA